jgi:outer membrane protein OmpA-like peptidoglycan-associated protein
VILLLCQWAWALGQSADIELLHSTYAPGAMPGLESPRLGDFGHFSAGLQTQYVRDPLVLYKDQTDQGAVIRRRQAVHLGIRFDLSQKVGFRLHLPTALQWASDHPDLARNGFGFGDLGLGVRYSMYDKSQGITSLSVGLRGDLNLPTSTSGAWLGEERTRTTIAASSLYSRRELDLLGEVGLHIRDPQNTGQDFVLGNEVLSGLGLRWNLWPEHFAMGSTVLLRNGTNNFLRGGAENSSELVSFVQWTQKDGYRWQLGTAKGLSSGYGTSQFRGFIAIRYDRQPTVEEIPVVEVDLPEEEIIIEEPVEEEPEWGEEELAKVEENQITIRGNIQFELGTDKILLESLPTVLYVATLINEDIQIGHVVIEGHASEEGSHEYNYDLSNLRARSIYRSLVRAGVHPDRLSHRGYGEAMPKTTGADEQSLAENRRVEFHIVRQDPEDAEPILREISTKPWDGTELKIRLPKPKPKPKPGIELDDDIFEEPMFDPELDLRPPEEATLPQNSSTEELDGPDETEEKESPLDTESGDLQ